MSGAMQEMVPASVTVMGTQGVPPTSTEVEPSTNPVPTITMLPPARGRAAGLTDCTVGTVPPTECGKTSWWAQNWLWSGKQGKAGGVAVWQKGKVREGWQRGYRHGCLHDSRDESQEISGIREGEGGKDGLKVSGMFLDKGV